MSRPEDVQRFSDAQRAGLDARQADKDRTLAAMHRLEAALGAAAPGREGEWRSGVASALAVLDATTADEVHDAEAPDSLLSDIARTQPRLRNRVRGVRLHYRHIRDMLGSLRREIDEGTEPDLDVADLRQRLGWVLSALRHQRARESDLIYEAYYEAFRADLAADGDRRDRDDR